MTASKRERVKEAVVKSLSMGASVLAACAGVQIGKSTFYRWLEGDASFEEAVMMARVGLIEEVMGELRLLAFGRYVEEERIVETATGPRKEWRKRWRDGKVSALMAILKMMEKDLAGMEAWRAGRDPQMAQMEQMEEGAEELTTKNAKSAKEEGARVEAGQDEMALSVGESQVSQFEARMTNDQCLNDQGGRGDSGLRLGVSQVPQIEAEIAAGAVAAGAGASYIEEGRNAVSAGVSQVSQNSLKTGSGGVVRESRQARRLRERQEFKAARLAAKASR